MQITYETDSHLLKIRKQIIDCNSTGIYRLKYLYCNKSYIGQTGRTLLNRFKEHIRSIPNNRDNSEYATHIINNRLTYCTMQRTTNKIDSVTKGNIMNKK
jgi:aminopeptidase-like protein